MNSADRESVPVSAALSRAWRAAEPNEHTIGQAYLRFLQKPPARARPQLWQVAGWVVVGMLLGMGSLYAATAGPWHSGRAEAPRKLDASLSGKAPRKWVAFQAPPGAAPVASSSAAIAASEQRGPSAPRQDPTLAARESWQRAAQSLRERDYATAADALGRLSEQGTKAERESAQLVRAQLLLSQGRSAAALELASALAASAEAASVRRKASELANEARKSSASTRSFEPAAGTNLR